MKKNDYLDYENNDERIADYELNIVVRDSCKTSENHISVENTRSKNIEEITSKTSHIMLYLIYIFSGLEMYYRWEKKSTKQFVSNSISSWAHLPIENLCIEPVKGSLNSNSTTLFEVIVQTEDLEACEYCTTLRCEYNTL